MKIHRYMPIGEVLEKYLKARKVIESILEVDALHVLELWLKL